MVGRISTTSIFSNAIRDINNTQTTLAEIQGQITSGRKASTFVEIGNDVSRIQELEGSIKSTGRYLNGNTIVLTRLRAMDLAVSQIQDIATDLSNNLATENSPTGAVFNLSEYVGTAFEQLTNALNSQIGGRYLFAGSKADQEPVSDLTLSTNVIAGQATANYYQGDDFLSGVKANDTLEIEYGITAGDSAFTNLVAALNTAIDFDQNGRIDDSIAAGDFLQTAIQDLATLRSKINNDIIAIETANTQHTRVEVQLNEVLEDIIGTDVVEASVQVALNEAVLTATMQTFARISNLTLTDFLR